MRRYAVLIGLLLAACGADKPKPLLVLEPRSGKPADLPGYRRWPEGIGVGARPEGDAAYGNLAALGFGAVLCVEANPPDVAAIDRAGLDCYHLPLGWSEMSTEQVRTIAKVVTSTDKGVFVYCGDGRVRSVVVATLARRCRGLSVDPALRDLRKSGVGNEHGMLARAVAVYKPLTESELDAARFPPARAELSALRARMVRVAELWRRFQADRTSPLASELAATFEAAMKEVKSTRPLLRRDFTQAQMAATLLAHGLSAKDRPRAERAYTRLKSACAACHTQHRN